MIPLVNAQVTKVEGGGQSEDYDAAAGAGTVRWQGKADAYVEEQLLDQAQGTTLTQVAVTRLVVPFEIGDLVERGDTVTYTAGGNSFSRKVQTLQPFRLFGTVSMTFFEV